MQWKSHIQRRVEAATADAPPNVRLLLPLVLGVPELPRPDLQVRYAERSMNEKGYELVRSRNWLLVQELVFQRNSGS